MKREILFRQAVMLRGKFQYWHYWGESDGGFISPICGSESAEESYQFTNLYDKNGKKIFEGDLFACRNTTTQQLMKPMVVKYFDGYFDIEQSDGRPHCIDLFVWNNGEVVGNLYENQELLKG